MTEKLPTVTETMRARMNPAWPAHVRAISERALSAFDSLVDKKKVLNSTAADFTEKLREGVAGHAAPMAARAAWEVQAGKRKLETDRAALKAKAIQHDSPHSAQMAAEVRTYLRSLKPGEAVQMLTGPNADKLAQIAVLESPAFLSGVSEDIRARAESEMLSKYHPDELATLDATAEGLAHAESAVTLAKGQMQRDLKFQPHEFAKFMEAVKPSAEQIAAEAAEAKAVAAVEREAFVEKRLAELMVA